MLSNKELAEVFENLDKSAEELSYVQNNQPYIINAAPQLIYPEKKFICKGKHQYREVKKEQKDGLTYVQWECQCGKTI